MALRSCILLSIIFGLAVGSLHAAPMLVPPGNRHAEQPAIPGASTKRTQASHSSFDAKYAKVYQLLEDDPGLIGKIRAVAEQYDIAPVHIVGAIIGEHTYNVDAYDRLQTYYVKAVSYLNSRFEFSYEGESVDAFIHRPEFAECDDAAGSYEVWGCREEVWENAFRGKTVDGKAYPDDRFGAVFFQPFYAGQTFGIGQINPLTALQMSDLVNETSGFARLDHRRPQAVYRTIMDPDVSLAYVAATLRKSMEAYEEIADFDISQNPGITATLYNLGDPLARAQKLAVENRDRRKNGLPVRLPQENYYGWLVNEKLEDLTALFSDS